MRARCCGVKESRKIRTTSHLFGCFACSLTCRALDIEIGGGFVKVGACGNPASAAPPPGNDKAPPLLIPPPLMCRRALTISLKEVLCRSNSACGSGAEPTATDIKWWWFCVMTLGWR